jgi:Holliday junction resolvase RusA-like endonuclease
MDTLKFTIKNVAPLSTNKLNSFNKFGGNKNSNIKKQTTLEIQSQLVKYTPDIRAFKRSFDKKNEVLSCYFKFYFPRDIFFTKKGELSSRRTDIDNCLKLSIDAITRFMEIDDKYIIDIVAEARPADNYEWVISFSKLHADFIL